MTTPSVTVTAVAPALVKLIEAVDEENAALRDQKIFTHAGFTDRKNQALRELMAAQRKEISAAAGSALAPLLRRLSHELQENSRLLKLHIAAVGEISDIIVNGLRDAESDGTYCRSGARGW